jgi:hypothetical protein
MSFVRRPRRRRRPSIHLLHDGSACAVVHPDPDEPIILGNFTAAAALAFELAELDVDDEALVLLDDDRRVTAILLDPPAELGLCIGNLDAPGLEEAFTHTLSIVYQPTVAAAVSSADIVGYRSLRRIHMLQGLSLLDVILTDGSRVHSIAIACDPDAAWFESFPATEPCELDDSEAA